MPPAALRASASLPTGAPVAAPSVGRPRSARPGQVSRELQDSWVARLKERDPQALREVIEAFGERLTAVVAGMLRDRDAVDDVVQETFTKAWFRIQSFAGDSGLYTWLYRVAINACKDHAKGRARRPAGSLTDLLAVGEPGLSAPASPPIEGLERRELRLAVQRAMARLPQRFRAVLALREIEGLPYQEIASVLGLSLGTVESRLFRARQRLAALLAKEGLGAPAARRPGAGDPEGTDDPAGR